MEHDFSARITARRMELGLTREEVARRTGIRLSCIEHLEQSHEMPDMGFLVRLAETLRTSIGCLTGKENAPPDESG
jgi:transcriptional regulator with XRE-family HTH domain